MNILQKMISKEFEVYREYIEDKFWGEYQQYIEIGIIALRNNLIDIFETSNLQNLINIILKDKKEKEIKKRIKKEGIYGLEVGELVNLKIKGVKFEGIYQGNIQNTPIFYIHKQKRYINGYECWWWPKK